MDFTRTIPVTRRSLREGVDVRCCGRVTGAVADGDIATGSLIEKIEAAFDEEDE